MEKPASQRSVSFFLHSNTLSSFFAGLLFFFFLPRLQSQCDNDEVLNITGAGTATWTAPSSGGPFSVRITATGAGGGSVTNVFRNSGGLGATMSGTFLVQNGQTIRA